MKLIKVSSKRTLKKFIQFPVMLYKNEKNWIRPLDRDIEDVFMSETNNYFKYGDCISWILERKGEVIGRIAAFFDTRKVHRDSNPSSWLIENVFNPEKNNYFESGDCICWILERKGAVIGRVAAFYDTRKLYRDFNQPTGGVGFFECIDDQEAANLLFDTAKNWLIENKMEAMDGPINFGDRSKWWGLLTKGYDMEPSYQCNYHLPYYRKLFENYGFKLYFNQFTFTRKIEAPLHPRLIYKARLIAENPDYTFAHLNMEKSEQQTMDIVEIYNKAWKNHSGVPQLTKEQGKDLFKKLKPIIDERIIWLAYYQNEPVAFYLNIPDINGILKFLNGKLGLIGKLKFLWYKKTIKKKKMLGVVFGVVPEHHGTGLDGALIINASKIIQNLNNTYPVLEINGIGDFNRKMILVVKQVGGEICKVHTTYRYLFDRDKPFKRMDFI